MSEERVIDTQLIGPLKSEAKVRYVEFRGDATFQVRDTHGTVIVLTPIEARDLAAFIVRNLI